MSDKIVTHADLPSLLQMRQEIPMDPTSQRAQILDRLIAAAEADRPPLPEGWASIEPHEVRAGDFLSVYYRGNDDPEGHRYVGRVKDEDSNLAIVDPERGWIVVWIKGLAVGPNGMTDYRRLTPLRPTVTEADIEKAARGFHEKGYAANWSALHAATRAEYRDNMRAAFEAAGIEVIS